MVDKRDSDFISNYDSFAPPVEEQFEPAPTSGAGKLLIFLIQLPSWIVAAFLAVVIYAQVSHSPVNLGFLQVSPALGLSSSAATGPSTDDLQKLSQKVDELSSKLDALAASRTTSSTPPQATAPGAAVAPSGPPPAPSKRAKSPAAPTSETAAAGATGGKTGLSGSVRSRLSQAIQHGRELSSEMTNYARDHGGSLGADRARFVRESDEWLNTTYNLLEDKVGGNVALNFMAAQGGSGAVSGVSADDSRLLKSIQAKMAILQRLVGNSGASSASADEDNDI